MLHFDSERERKTIRCSFTFTTNGTDNRQRREIKKISNKMLSQKKNSETHRHTILDSFC